MRLFGAKPPGIAPTPSEGSEGADMGSEGTDRRIAALETALEALQGRVAGLEASRVDMGVFAQETRVVLDAYESKMTDLTFAVSEGIAKVERAENRIRSTVRRARAELEEHGLSSPGLDAEAKELRLVDGSGGEPEGVPSVPAVVETPDTSDLPGDWRPEDLELLRSG